MKKNWAKVEEFVPVYNEVKKNIIKNDHGRNPQLINEFMDNFEEFFCQAVKLQYVTTSNVESVLNRLKGIQKVGYLVEPFKGKNSYSYKNKTGIFINPDLSNDMQAFSIFKELSRISLSYDRNLTNSASCRYIEEQNDLKVVNDFKLLYLDLGFRLIEDGISLDMAENIYASYKKVPREAKKLNHEEGVFGKKISILSNFKHTPSFQELTTLIGRKFLKNGAKVSDDQVLYDLSKHSLREGFTQDFISSLSQDFGKEKMFELVGKLGIIYKKEMDDSKSFLNINPYLRVVHARKALKDIYSMVDANKVIRLRRAS